MNLIISRISVFAKCNRTIVKHLLLIGLIVFFGNAAIAQSFLGTVRQNVNLREGPGKDYEVLMTLKKGAQVFISSILPEDGYYSVIDIASNRTGFVHRDYVLLGEALPENKEGIFNPSGEQDEYNPQVEIFNNTVKTMTLRLNDEIYTFAPKEKKKLSLQPARYEYTASAPGVIPDYGSETLQSNMGYTWQFYIVTTRR